MIPLAKDAWAWLWKLVALALVLWLFGLCALGWLVFGLACFVAFFFRDPDRTTPMDPDIAVSPADGKVMRIEEMAHEEFIGGPAKKIVIFLNVFNVHINRSPITGTVAMTDYRAGKMLPAYKTHASEENERNTIGIEGKEGHRVLVHQITGLIARRIVCHVSTGDKLLQGQRYGLIKFGSCTELVVPASAEVLVEAGDIVRGSESVLARFS